MEYLKDEDNIEKDDKYENNDSEDEESEQESEEACLDESENSFHELMKVPMKVMIPFMKRMMMIMNVKNFHCYF
jgi:hypothetical protein